MSKCSGGSGAEPVGNVKRWRRSRLAGLAAHLIVAGSLLGAIGCGSSNGGSSANAASAGATTPTVATAATPSASNTATAAATSSGSAPSRRNPSCQSAKTVGALLGLTVYMDPLTASEARAERTLGVSLACSYDVGSEGNIVLLYVPSASEGAFKSTKAYQNYRSLSLSNWADGMGYIVAEPTPTEELTEEKVAALLKAIMM
jgi:hypothetical protein